MSKNVLLLGRTKIVLDDVTTGLAVENATLFSGTTLEDVRKAFEDHAIDIVIMGAGLDWDSSIRSAVAWSGLHPPPPLVPGAGH